MRCKACDAAFDNNTLDDELCNTCMEVVFQLNMDLYFEQAEQEDAESRDESG